MFMYHIVGIFGGVFNLVVWRSREKNAKLKTGKIEPCDSDSLVAGLNRQINTAFWMKPFNARQIFPLYSRSFGSCTQ